MTEFYRTDEIHQSKDSKTNQEWWLQWMKELDFWWISHFVYVQQMLNYNFVHLRLMYCYLQILSQLIKSNFKQNKYDLCT